MPARILLLTALLALAILACSDNNEPTGPVEQAPQLADYLWFDTTSLLIVRSPQSGGAETYIDADSIVGEPFGDANGNGVYDRGIDTFVMSLDPAVNMDFNHNGRHDGWTDPYYVGEPFDDYNLNGVYDQPDQRYEVGEPFLDIDGDGTWDAGLAGQVVKGRWDVVDSIESVYRWYYCDSIARWVSDSGGVYVFPAHKWVWDFSRDDFLRDWSVSVRRTADGLVYEGSNQWVFPLTGPGAAQVGVETVAVAYITDTARMVRSTEFGQSVTYDSTTYDNLLRIRFDSLVLGSGFAPSVSFAEFYFSLDRGFFLAVWQMYGDSHFYDGPMQAGIIGMVDSVPLPLIRETAQP